MSTKFIMLDTITAVDQKFTRQWLSGTGDKAKFRDDSEGWYAVFSACPASMYLGAEKPGLKAGDRVRLTLEKI